MICQATLANGKFDVGPIYVAEESCVALGTIVNIFFSIKVATPFINKCFLAFYLNPNLYFCGNSLWPFHGANNFLNHLCLETSQRQLKYRQVMWQLKNRIPVLCG